MCNFYNMFQQWKFRSSFKITLNKQVIILQYVFKMTYKTMGLKEETI